MKKIILSFAFSLIAVIAYGQMVVEDPALLGATLTNWAEQLDQAWKQYSEIQEQTSKLQQQIDRFRKVNSTIKNAQLVKNIIEKQVNLVSMISGDISTAGGNVLHQEAYNAYKRKMTSIANASSENVDLLQLLITDDALQMSDYERLQFIEDLNERTNNLIQTCHYETKRYNTLNDTLAELNRLMKK